VANKIGTYTLACSQSATAFPFTLRRPSSSVTLPHRTGTRFPSRSASADEVTGYAGMRWAPEGVSVANPAFDITPAL